MKPEQIQAAKARAVAAWRKTGSPRLGMRGYLCVLAYITAAPATAQEVAQAFDSGRQHMRELLQRMGELGMAHTAGAQRTGRAGPPSALWAAGHGIVERLGVPCRLRCPELMQLRRILAALDDPVRCQALARETGSHAALVSELLGIAHALRMVHVCAWDMPNNPQGGGAPVPCWVLGPGKDAPRPKRQGNAEVKRRWREANAARKQTEQILAALWARPAEVGAAC